MTICKRGPLFAEAPLFYASKRNFAAESLIDDVIGCVFLRLDIQLHSGDLRPFLLRTEIRFHSGDQIFQLGLAVLILYIDFRLQVCGFFLINITPWSNDIITNNV